MDAGEKLLVANAIFLIGGAGLVVALENRDRAKMQVQIDSLAELNEAFQEKRLEEIRRNRGRLAEIRDVLETLKERVEANEN